MKRILSIDGGGIRGIIPLAALVKVEARYGKPAREIFDFLAGTSTGSVIAAGLALGISARGLLSLYRNLARQAFQRLPWWQTIANLGNHRYSTAFIESTLNEIGADLPLNQLPLDVMISAKNLRTSRTDFFVRDHPGNARLWGTLSLKDAVLASIAAPTYFPPHIIDYQGSEFIWVDGGVGIAGNPCYQAAVEALHYTSGEFQEGDTMLMSFGTGRVPHPIDGRRANLLQWGLWALAETLEDSADWQTYVTRREYGHTGRMDFRRYQLDLASDVLLDLGVDLPEGVDPSRIGLDALWAIDLLEDVGRAFADRIDFDHPHGLELESGQAWA
jgi:uncharacterized protein